MKSLYNRRFCRIHPEQRIDLSLYLSLQYLRTREARESLLQVSETLYKESFLAYLESKSPEIKVSREDFDIVIDDDKRASYHAMSILNEDLRDNLATIIHDHYWVILKNETAMPFYTSDHPLVKRGHVKHPILSMQGFSSLGVEIALPLNPEFILVIAEKTEFPQLKKHNGKLKTINKEENVVYYNRLQVKHSYRQIFSKNQDFDLAISMIEETPSLRETDFKRIETKVYVADS